LKKRDLRGPCGGIIEKKKPPSAKTKGNKGKIFTKQEKRCAGAMRDGEEPSKRGRKLTEGKGSEKREKWGIIIAKASLRAFGGRGTKKHSPRTKKLSIG